MANIKQEFGTSTALTITLASLSNSATAGRESDAVDNSSNKYSDILIGVKVKPTTGTIANDKAVYVYAAVSEDGTNFSGEATGANAAYTVKSPTNLILLGRIEVPTANTTYYKVFNLGKHLKSMPRKFGIIIRNYCGIAFTGTAGDHGVTYTGVYHTSS